jgi:hypothetical protein
MNAFLSLSTRGYKKIQYGDLDYKMFKIAFHFLKKNFKKVYLITDDYGYDVLKNIPFTDINTSLEQLVPKDYNIMWALGKIYAYKIACEMGEPFIHIDNDVFLFERFNQKILYNPIITQHQELGVWFLYHAEQFINCLPNKYYFNYKKINNASNMGIFGGTDLNFIHFYATESLKVSLDPENMNAIRTTFFNTPHSPPCMTEQYYVNLLADLTNKNIHYLLPNNSKIQKEAYNLKYCHIWGFKSSNRWLLEQYLDNIIYRLNLYY